MTVLTEGMFMTVPGSYPSHGLPSIMAEYTWDDMPPLFLTLNTCKNTPPGDYDIHMVLLYSDGTDVESDKNKIAVHVKGWIERNGKKVALIGAIGTAFSLLTALINYINPFLPL